MPAIGWSAGPVLEGVFPQPLPFRLEVRYAPGTGTTRTWQASGPGGNADLELEAESEEQPEDGAVVLRWRLVARTDLHLHEVRPVVASWPHPEPPERLRVFRNGFQSWTPTGSVRGVQRRPRQWIRSFALMNHYVDSPFRGRRDGLHSHDLLILRGADEEESALMGFLTWRAGLGEFFLRNRGQGGLEVGLDYGGRRMAPGDMLEGEPLWCARGRARVLRERWADVAATASGARVPARTPVGWCSWYEYYQKVREADVLANLEALQAHPELGVDLLQVDDGWQRSVGDWQETSAAFPRGMGPLAADIRAAGLTPGIWLAPFFAAPRSRLHQEHPAWLLRTPGGRPVDCGLNPAWRSRLHALDLTHPEVEAWLREVFGGLAHDGFDYFKIDFLFAGLRHGVRHDPRCSPVEAYRRGLGAIREAVGERAFLLGCGAPLGPSLGFVDGMRISADVKERWDHPVLARVAGDAGYPSARLALVNDLTRSFLHRRWWLNDPDCLLVRDHATRLSLTEVKTLVTVLGMTGGMLFLSDDLGRLAPERLDMARAVLPPTRLVGRVADLMERDQPEHFVLESAAGRLVALVNWSSRTVKRPLPLSAEGGVLFDMWRGRPLDGEEPVEIAPHGVRAILRMEPSTHPFVVGTTFHLCALVDGRLAGRYDPEARVLTVTGRRMARRSGKVWLRLPSGLSLDLDRLPPEVERVDGWADGVVLTVAGGPSWSLALPFRPTR